MCYRFMAMDGDGNKYWNTGKVMALGYSRHGHMFTLLFFLIVLLGYLVQHKGVARLTLVTNAEEEKERCIFVGI
jgi:hypothetical protein